MLTLEHVIESKLFINCYKEVLQKYMQYGARSSKKVDYFHEFIKSQIENVLCDKQLYQVKLEQNVVSMNAKQRKKCDIVAYKNDKPYIVFPVKLTMTNYKQNKNNAWENLTGEIMHLKWANSDDFHIVPINIYMNQVPYLDNNKTIKKFEKISYNDIKSCVSIIDIVSTRGAFKGPELSSVGQLRDKLALFVEKNKPPDQDTTETSQLEKNE